uniref:Uncharacterized protein n=1 Tax=Arion vulgaris TaxID=1028688 RepID=A0A0B6Y0B4_9EUPU
MSTCERHSSHNTNQLIAHTLNAYGSRQSAHTKHMRLELAIHLAGNSRRDKPPVHTSITA